MKKRSTWSEEPKKKHKGDEQGHRDSGPATGTGKQYYWRDCHKLTEIMPGLWLGSKYHALDMTRAGVDVLVPLDSVSGAIWEEGWRGKVYYVPITDGGVLPDDVAMEKAEQVVRWVREGKKVGVFCIGGHGRTGYFAGLVLGLMGVEDPVTLLRRAYCKNSVETKEQVDSLVRLLGVNDEIAKEWKPVKYETVYGYTYPIVYSSLREYDFDEKAGEAGDPSKKVSATGKPDELDELEEWEYWYDDDGCLWYLCPICRGKGCTNCVDGVVYESV